MGSVGRSDTGQRSEPVLMYLAAVVLHHLNLALAFLTRSLLLWLYRLNSYSGS